MSEAKEPRTTTPGSLLSQWWTLGAIALDKRTAGRHMSAAWVIIDRYMQSKGGSRASLRYIETATGLSKPTVIGACRELVEWGYFTRDLGTGTRPTEYVPNWLVVNPSLPLASGQHGFTTGGQDGFTATAASGEQGLTKDLLTSPADKPADSKVGTADTPDPQPADGLAATAAGSRDPVEAFDRFWAAYPRKYQKPKARAAWEKLHPDPALAERIVAASAAWAAHYAEHAVNKRWIPAPANWLSGERYDEDLPEVYVDAKQAATAKKMANRKAERASDNDNTATTEWVGDISPLVPPGRHSATIAAVDARERGDIFEIEFTLDIDTGKLVQAGTPHCFFLQHPDPEVQRKGNAFFEGICNSAGVPAPEDVDDFLGKQVVMDVRANGTVCYVPHWKLDKEAAA